MGIVVFLVQNSLGDYHLAARIYFWKVCKPGKCSYCAAWKANFVSAFKFYEKQNIDDVN